MFDLPAILILGCIALFVLLRRQRPVSGHGEVIVRLYERGKLRVERASKCKTSMHRDVAVVTEAYVGLITEKMVIDRITVALVDFPEKECDTKLQGPVFLNAGDHLTVAPVRGERGILTLT